MNKLGLDVTAVGNHEFDEGYKELQRMAFGGCIADGAGQNNQNSCAAHEFRGADFDYLAANVRYAGTNETILPSYSIKKVHGAKIGFIGMTLKDTPSIVTASGVAGLEFTDEVRTANALVPLLRRKGVNAIVVLIHQGGNPEPEKWTDPATKKTYDANPTYDYTCGKGGKLAASSPILPIAANLDPAIDMVVSGHTHQPYVCKVKDPDRRWRLLTSASSFGRLFTETNLVYDKRTRDIVRGSVSGSNLQVSRDVPKDAAQSALVAEYTKLVAPIADKVLGTITANVTKKQNAAGESALGDLIADAQLADPSVVTGGQKPVVAFMNPGGIRADLSYAPQPPPKVDAPGQVTYEEAFTVQPFNNYLVSLTLTGQQIYDVLAQQVTGSNAPAENNKILQVSKGFSYQLGDLGCRSRQRADQRRADQPDRVLPDRHEQLPRRRWGRLQGVRVRDLEVLRWARHRRVRGLPGGQLAVHPGAPDPDHQVAVFSLARPCVSHLGSNTCSYYRRAHRQGSTPGSPQVGSHAEWLSVAAPNVWQDTGQTAGARQAPRAHET